ncbi:MAG TPA: energy transducer TonB [Thermoanaerobaculia bacterium]|nr:energy transducer TonB [Thermoanaerobaculia bacterium]
MTPPQAIHRVRPDYPESMRQAKSMGRIVLDGVIDEKGCVRSLHVHDTSDADFGPAAIEAARQWLFQPATEDGRPIKVYYSLTINFDIEKGAPK